MEYFFCIDATGRTLKGGIFAVAGGTVSISRLLPEGIPNPFIEQPINEESSIETSSEGDSPTEESRAETRKNLIDTVREAIAQFTAQPLPTWRSSLLIVEPHFYLALNVTLPFRDPKVIRRVIQPEVQDAVPFDIDEFLIAHQVTGQFGDNQFDVLAQLLPRESMADLLATSRQIGFEPHAVATPGAIVGQILPSLLQNQAPQSSGILVIPQMMQVHFVAWIDGAVRLYKSTPLQGLTSAQDLWIEAQLFRRSVEQRYQQSIDRVRILSTGDFHSLPDPGSIPWEPLDGSMLVGTESHSGSLSTLIAMCGTKACAGAPLSQLGANLRIAEFTFKPHTEELRRVSKALRWYLLLFSLALVLVPIFVYAARAHYLSSLQSELTEKVGAALNRSDVPQGGEVDFVIKENARLERLLRDLGSPTAASPLETFLEVSKDMPADAGTELRRINIKGNRVRLEGSAPNYSSVEAIEKALKRNRRTYCRTKKETSQAAGGRRGYAFDLWLCE